MFVETGWFGSGLVFCQVARAHIYIRTIVVQKVALFPGLQLFAEGKYIPGEKLHA